MTGDQTITRLALLGVRVSLSGSQLKAGPRHALNDEAREIIGSNREALILALSGFPEAHNVRSAAGCPDATPPADHATEAAVARPSARIGADCSGCARLEMRFQPMKGTRRIYHWRCLEGFALLEARYYGARVIVAPPECDRFTPWQPGSP